MRGRFISLISWFKGKAMNTTANSTVEKSAAAPTSPNPPREQDIWASAEALSCYVRAEIDVPHFTVRDLFCLEAGAILDAGWLQSSDVPLKANSQLIGWAEFEVIGDELAVRVTELY